MFETRMKLVGAEGAKDLKAIAADRLGWLDGQLVGRTWVCGSRFTLADILLFAFISFGAQVGQPLPVGLPAISAWFDRMKARPSARA